MKKITICILVVAAMLTSCTLKSNHKNKESTFAKRPNVLLILTDDQGYGDLSCHGNPILKTPAMDKLYDESVVFTDFHVSSICTPTRSQLLTGVDACRNGAFAWAYSREIIHPDVPTMPEIFKANGYATGHFGKWHLGDNYPFRPIDRGFDESVKHGGASIYQTPDYWDNDYQDDYFEHNGVMQAYKGYCADVWFEETKKFIKKSKEAKQPFFIYLPTNTPHSPHIVSEKYSTAYYDTLKQGFDQVPEFYSKKDKSMDISWFYGMIANIDENLAKLDTFLKKEDVFNNTILVFMSDNGGTGGVQVYNAGMRGKKTSLYEGGHRVPFFLRWPDGGYAQHKEVHQLTHVQDVLPTLLDLCGLTSTTKHFDGQSLKMQLKDPTQKLGNRMLVMQNARAPLPTKYDATVMWNKWRLVKHTELYDISKDLVQQNNIISQYPQVADKMRAHYEKWWKGVQPSLQQIPHFPIGLHEGQEQSLTCFDWYGKEGEGNVTVQPDIREGKNVSGYWNVEAITDGTYEIQCARWPKEANTPIQSGLPAHKTLTITYPKGIALPIASTSLVIDGQKQDLEVKASEQFSTFRVTLNKGKHRLQADFLDSTGAKVCGAYYVYIKKESSN